MRQPAICWSEVFLYLMTISPCRLSTHIQHKVPIALVFPKITCSLETPKSPICTVPLGSSNRFEGFKTMFHDSFDEAFFVKHPQVLIHCDLLVISFNTIISLQPPFQTFSWFVSCSDKPALESLLACTFRSCVEIDNWLQRINFEYIKAEMTSTLKLSSNFG